MATVTAWQLPYRILTAAEEEEDSSSDPTNAVAFVGMCLLIGIACRHLLRGTSVPYTVALLILGIGLGSIEYGTHHRLGRIGDGIRIWANIDPDLLLAVFLPALLFESSFSMEVHQIKSCMVQMMILAGPGVLISTFVLGSALKLTFPYDWSWKTSLLLGGLLSATDPVAVIALLKELGASKKLSTIIEGESMMNDGIAIVVYQLFYQMVLGKSYDLAAIIKFLSQVAFESVGIGLAFGMVSVLWLRFIFNDTVIEITLTLAVSYVAYFIAQESVGVSGVLTVTTLGMFYAAVARTAFKSESQQSLHHFWEMVAYIANTLVFILSGVVIAEGVLSSENIFDHGKSWLYLILLYVYVQIARFIVVAVSFPLLQYFGYGLDWKEAIILIWSGLRGAVALSLSLSVKQTSDSSSLVSSDTGVLFVFFTGGIVFLTLVVNGSTTCFILRLLDLDKLSAAKRRVLEYTKYEMLNKAIEAFGDLGDDEELGPADWPSVKRYIAIDVDTETVRPHKASESDNSNNPHVTNLKDIRERLLNVQAAYWNMLDEGRITQSTANILMQSVDESIDLVSREPLCDWKGLKAHVRFPNCYKFLQTSIFPQKLATYLTVERLESACYICASFLRAHRIARQELHDFIGYILSFQVLIYSGDSEVASIVINESEAEGEEAKKFLEDVRATFPQVLRVVKTRQVTFSSLNHLTEYLQILQKVGMLEEKETLHLHDAVQTDMKKLLRNPPSVKIPKINDLISLHPLTGALPPSVLEPIEASTKETMKLCGVTLYEEGSKPTGIWLLSTGVVKWTSKSIKNKHSLHPTFTHGSTLGLYEALTGKPYICDMTTDSVVLCFCIQTHKINSMLRSDPSVEDFLWQESSIALLKLFLPQIFEKMAMQDLRTLVAERSVMTIYSRDESFEIPYHSIGFLLEGFVRTQGVQEELITSPAPLFPSHGYQSFQNLETSGTRVASFSHKGSSYLVETRSRVIIFDMAAFESDSALIRRSSPFVSSALDHHLHGSFTGEHSGLMSWPEQISKAKQQKQNPEAIDQQNNSLSARAMQLSIYGSRVNVNQRRRARSFPRSGPVNPSHAVSYPSMPSYQGRSHNVSYPSVPSHHCRPLVSIRSEGAMTLRKNLEVRKFTGQTNAPGQQSTNPNKSHEVDDSSDGSAGEDDVIVRID